MSQIPEWECDSTGERRARTGGHEQIDTGKLRALDGMPCEEEDGFGSDPYNQILPAPPHPSEKARRRLLDDMRQFSERIKLGRKK